MVSSIFPDDGKPKISILDFKFENVGPKFKRMCYRRLETSLIESDKFRVIEKGRRDRILQAEKFQSSGICNVECAVEIGRLVGAEYLILGEIIGSFGLYQIDIKIINIDLYHSLQEEITMEVESGAMGRNLSNGMEEASRKIVSRIFDPQYIVHRVSYGESLWTISKKYGVSIHDLAVINKIKSRHKIKVGNKLKITPDITIANEDDSLAIRTSLCSSPYVTGCRDYSPEIARAQW